MMKHKTIIIVNDQPFVVPQEVLAFLPHLENCARSYGGRVYVPILSPWITYAFGFIVTQLAQTRCSIDARDYVMPSDPEIRNIILELLVIYGAPAHFVNSLCSLQLHATHPPPPSSSHRFFVTC
jgi:hypothetical protein